MEKCPKWCAKWHIRCILCQRIIHKGETTRKIRLYGKDQIIHGGC